MRVRFFELAGAGKSLRLTLQNGGWAAEKVIDVEPVEVEGWPFPRGSKLLEDVGTFPNVNYLNRQA